MRAARASTTRKAELRPRRLVDFVSPAQIGSAVFLIFAAIFFDFYVHGFVFDWRHDTVQRAIILIAGNLFFAVFGGILLRAKMLNPHQAFEDRSRQIAANLTSLVYVSMAVSVFLIVKAAGDVFDLRALDATLMSLYFQAIAVLSIGHLLRTLKVEEIDFDVYRSESVAS